MEAVATSGSAPVSGERRRDILSQAIQREVAAGGRVESRGDYDAVMVKGRRVNHILHLILTLLTVGIWLIVWVLVTITGGEKRSVITVDEFGRVNIQGRSSGGFSPLMVVGVIAVIIILVTILGR